MNAYNLKPGDMVTLKIQDREEGSGIRIWKKKTLKVIKKYQNFILFVDKMGIRTCYGYWEAQKMLDAVYR